MLTLTYIFSFGTSLEPQNWQLKQQQFRLKHLNKILVDIKLHVHVGLLYLRQIQPLSALTYLVLRLESSDDQPAMICSSYSRLLQAIQRDTVHIST